MAVNTTSAVEKLKPSRLVNAVQMEALGGDLDVDKLHLQIQQGTGLDVTTCVTDITIDRTIDGASTITVNCDDTDDRAIQLSGTLGHRVDINIDGLFFTLVGVKKTGRALSLTFEEREVNILRRYNKPIYSARKTPSNPSGVTRAQFVLRMIHEVKEEKIRWCIPELNIQQPVSDVSGHEILVDSNFKPKVTASQIADATTAAQERHAGVGVSSDTHLTMRGGTPTREQIKNANLVMQTGVHMHAPRKVMIAAMTTAITESACHNYPRGYPSGTGVFQQDPRYWPASANVTVDAKAFYQRCMAQNIAYPNVSIHALCQLVQHSGAGANNNGGNYAPWEKEGTQWVDQFSGIVTNEKTLEAQLRTGTGNNANNLFMRGTLAKVKGVPGKFVLTPENSWTCMNRLAQEVNWRAFVVSGTVYFVSENWLFKSKPFMTINEDSDGIDWIDYDYDEGKHKATLTITAHLKRWSCPPGGTIDIFGMGLVDGKYLVEEVSRSAYDNIATITAEKPLPILPEPTSLAGIPAGATPTASAGGKSTDIESGTSLKSANQIQKVVVTYAKQQLGVPYLWGGDSPATGFDCSGLAQAAYAAAGIYLGHYTGWQWNYGRRLGKHEQLLPGDLLFFEPDKNDVPQHVGIYIGSSNMIDAPHTGAKVRVDNYHQWGSYLGATRPWQHGK